MTTSMLSRSLSLAAALTLGLVGTASAVTLVLDTGKSESVTAGSSGSFVFSTTNSDAGDVTADFLSWTLGIQVLPAGSSNTGTLTVGTLSAAGTDPMPVGTISVAAPALNSLGTAINGTTDYYGMGIESTDTLGTLVSGSSYNLGSLQLAASANASGTWNVFAVQQNVPIERSFWTNGSASNVAFGNLAFGQGNTSVLIGTVTAVPEPATCGMAFAIFGIAGLVARRTIRRTSRN